MKEQHKKILMVGGAGVVALILLKGGKADGFAQVGYVSGEPTGVGLGTSDGDALTNDTGFKSPVEGMTYEQFSKAYQSHLVEKYPIKSTKRPDTGISIIDVLNVGGQMPFDIKTGEPLKGKEPVSSIYENLGN